MDGSGQRLRSQVKSFVAQERPGTLFTTTTICSGRGTVGTVKADIWRLRRRMVTRSQASVGPWVRMLASCTERF